ncbi:GNAT family N-acetyltransferase [Gramella sp. GC03-9]|uniref:GNAT family N-acetyltransferase n=1 Tax=Christiangramia oceanisediminis TaxID=2920386 RepID=A0A9X2KVI7_9FLAO|nr:GNAT family N-acetyltransferase [Gramella oceanisediminis]MCP9199212.1 GNAT family N-acetyltransferase [Gramella oceanisediminis]
MIQLAQISELQEIKNLTEACAKAMQGKGIFQWNEHYPSLQKLEEDIHKKELYVLKEEKMILGIIVLTNHMDEEYVPIEWLSKTNNNLYVHRLAVHPSVWGEGYGQQLMDFAESMARQQNYESVRLDTFSQNQRNQRFYEARGYTRLGDIYFPKQSEHPFYCYELLIK